MDRSGNIYQLTDDEKAALLAAEREQDSKQIDAAKLAEIREDVARLDGYLKGRAESDAPKRGAGSNRDLAG